MDVYFSGLSLSFERINDDGCCIIDIFASSVTRHVQMTLLFENVPQLQLGGQRFQKHILKKIARDKNDRNVERLAVICFQTESVGHLY